jgi:hypothetical protein
MLDEIELLVGGGGPEVLAVVSQFFLLLFALFVGDGHAALFTEGRIGQNIVKSLIPVLLDQGIVALRMAWLAGKVAHVVQEHIHQCQAIGGR